MGVEVAIDDLKRDAIDGDLYEIHERFISLHNKAKRGRTPSVHPLSDPIWVLYEGIVLMFENNRFDLSLNLWNVLVEYMQQKNSVLTPELLEMIRKICVYCTMERKGKAFATHFVYTANRYIVEHTSDTTDLQQSDVVSKAIAVLADQHEEFDTALRIYSRLGDPNFAEKCVELVHMWAKKSGQHYLEEVDYFLTRFILQSLLAHKFSLCTEVCRKFVASTCTGEDDIASATPLVRFCVFLSALCEKTQGEVANASKNEAALYTHLVEVYQPSLSRDAKFKAMLKRIGQNFFGIAATTQANPLGSLMSSLFGGGGGSGV